MGILQFNFYVSKGEDIHYLLQNGTYLWDFVSFKANFKNISSDKQFKLDYKKFTGQILFENQSETSEK